MQILSGAGSAFPGLLPLCMNSCGCCKQRGLRRCTTWMTWANVSRWRSLAASASASNSARSGTLAC